MSSRYKTAEILKTEEGTRYYKNMIYPEIPLHEDDIYVMTTSADRYDILALQYYKDSSLWWVIASANNSKLDSIVVEQGIQLRIPCNVNAIVRNFEDFNKST